MARLPPYYRNSFFASSVASSSRDSITASPSFYTTTSASFVAGPGELTGRGLNAIGKMTLRGVRNIVVRRRLQVMNSFIPHGDETAIPGLEQMYSDLLELSRFGLYSPSIRKRALRMILRQIAHEHTAQLAQSILDWPLDESVLFLSELLLCMDPNWTGLEYSRMPIHIELQGLYSSFLAQLPDGEHQATPFVKFIAQIASTGATGAQAVIDAKFLDVILALYISAFVPQVPAYRSSLLFLECNRLLSHLAVHPEGFEILCGHPIHLLWPRRALMPLTKTVRRQVEDRRFAWRSLHQADPSTAVRRITGMDEILEISMRNFGDISTAAVYWRDFPSNELVNTTTDVFDDFVDLIEFLRSDIYGEGVASRARRTLVRNIASLGPKLAPSDRYQDVLDHMHSQILREEIKCRDSIEEYFLMLDNDVGEKSVPLTKHLMEAIRKTIGSEAITPSNYRAGVLAVPLHMIKDVFPPDKPPSSKDLGPRLLYYPAFPSSPPSTSPFCSSPTLYRPFRRNGHQRIKTKSKQPAISTPYNIVHLHHVGFDSSTGSFTGLPEEWEQVMGNSGISISDQEIQEIPEAVMEIY